MIWLFSVTLFLSALLLFSVQPLMGKMLLPLFGGAPAVWQTALVFFQAALLGGYAYAHWTSRWLSSGRRLLLHAGLLVLAGLVLPLSVGPASVTAEMTNSSQAWHLLLTLLRVVGLPFLILSSTSPLLQEWFSRSAHVTARDPYYLSVASNLGSFVALLAFPIAVEPFATLRQASWGWTAAYAALVPLILICGWVSRRSTPPGPAPLPASLPPGAGDRPAWPLRLRWMAMAAVPSSLMLGLTSFITTEVASIPLLGVLPLAVYLATFVLAFARRRWLPVAFLSRCLPFAAVCLTFQIYTESTHPIALIVVLHLVFFFVGALLCHSRLADVRPSTTHLTEFYLWMSVGGVVGGLFNAMLAPLIFNGIVEYPLAMVLACGFIVRPRPPGTSGPRRGLPGDLAMAGVIAVVMAVLALVFNRFGWLEPFPRRVVLLGIGVLLVFLQLNRPWRFALSLGGVLLSTLWLGSQHGEVLDVERNFFGVSRVTRDPDGRSHRLVHGNTIHGRQFVTPDWSCDPLTYFHRSGPLGRIFRIFEGKQGRGRVAVTGLGCGAIAGYARGGQVWDYYEIDPAVIRIANDPRLFRFLKGCSTATLRVIPGDARLRLQEAEQGGYDLLIMDAFTSDSIPLHLLTREAVSLYLSKLAPEGLLAINISNRYLELAPVVAALAADAGLKGLHWDDPFEEKAAGKEPSHWAVLSRSAAALERFRRDERWVDLQPLSGGRPWTDDYSNILGVMKWR